VSEASIAKEESEFSTLVSLKALMSDVHSVTSYMHSVKSDVHSVKSDLKQLHKVKVRTIMGRGHARQGF
jgi:hypothetical protein